MTGNTQNKKKIINEKNNEEDEEVELKYALIKWTEEQTEFSVVKAFNIISRGSNLKIGKSYDVKLGKEYFEGVLVKIGTQLECENHLKSLCEYEKNKTSEKKQKKKPDNRTRESSNNKDVEDLKNSLKERDSFIKTLESKIEKLESELSTKNEQLSSMRRCLDNSTKEKLVQMSKQILRHFGTTNDLTDISVVNAANSTERVVILSEDYPEVKVPIDLKKQIDLECKIPNRTGSRLFRLLVGSILYDNEYWVKASADTVLKQYPDLISSCQEYVNRHKLFTKSDCRKCLREMACEARRRKKKNTDENRSKTTVSSKHIKTSSLSSTSTTVKASKNLSQKNKFKIPKSSSKSSSFSVNISFQDRNDNDESDYVNDDEDDESDDRDDE